MSFSDNPGVSSLEEVVSSIVNQINKYIDRMPKLSRVTYPDLVSVVSDELMNAGVVVAEKEISQMARYVVSHRDDLMILRGKGIVKNR